MVSFLFLVSTSFCLSCLSETEEMTETHSDGPLNSCDCSCHSTPPAPDQIRTVSFQVHHPKSVLSSLQPSCALKGLTVLSFAEAENTRKDLPLSLNPALPNVLRI